MNKFSAIFEGLAQAPDTQLDASIAKEFKELSLRTHVSSDEIHTILDKCVYASLASDFVMNILHVVWDELLANEGITKQQAIERKHGKK